MANKIEFGVSTWLWDSPFNNDSISLFPKISEMGFDVVEIPVEDPELIDIETIKMALDDNGLKATVCGVFGPSKDLTSENALLHENCFEYLKNCFEICAALDVKFLAGPMYSAVGKARLVSSEQRKVEWELAVNNLIKVCKSAKPFDMEIALEPLNRFESDMVNNVHDVLRLVTDINEVNAKVMLDGFHMTIEEADIRKAINLAGSKLIHIQVSENHRGIPGTGLTPWREFARGLEDVDYHGAIVIESFTPEIKELAAAVCIWRNLAESQDEFASKGLRFLHRTFKN